MMLMYYCERWMYLNNYNFIFDIMYEVGIYKQISICLGLYSGFTNGKSTYKLQTTSCVLCKLNGNKISNKL